LIIKLLEIICSLFCLPKPHLVIIEFKEWSLSIQCKKVFNKSPKGTKAYKKGIATLKGGTKLEFSPIAYAEENMEI